ncbi:MAG: hypothetical protein ABI946_09570 [Chthoniobacterales bacterium]
MDDPACPDECGRSGGNGADGRWQRALRALGVKARDPWDPACQSLFGKRYIITGRLFTNSRYDNQYAEAVLKVDDIQSQPEPSEERTPK